MDSLRHLKAFLCALLHTYVIFYILSYIREKDPWGMISHNIIALLIRMHLDVAVGG